MSPGLRNIKPCSWKVEDSAAKQGIWQNAGLTLRNINFCFAIVQQLLARRNFSQQKILS
jgi:hypothetical protein